MILTWFCTVDWNALAQMIIALSTLALAGIGWFGLKTWKNQTSTQIKLKFIDEIINSVHAFINSMEAPLSILEMLEVQISSYSKGVPEGEKNIEGVISFIQRTGKGSSDHLKEYLEKARQHKITTLALAVKGEVYGFEDYPEFLEACKALVFSFDQLEHFGVFVGLENLNYKNELVVKRLEEVLELRSKEIISKNQGLNQKILTLSREWHSKLLK